MLGKDIVTLLLTSQIVLWIVQFFVTRYFSKKDDIEEIKKSVVSLSESDKEQDALLVEHSSRINTIRSTTGALIYKALSDLIKSAEARGYASVGDRKVIREINKAYKANGYNGDFDDAIARVECLPYNP